MDLPSRSDIFDFRKAVKVKNSDILVGVSPSQLKVYKNKSSFDAGDEPLDEFSLLDKMSVIDEENALIVVVPLPSGMSLLCQEYVA